MRTLIRNDFLILRENSRRKDSFFQKANTKKDKQKFHLSRQVRVSSCFTKNEEFSIKDFLSKCDQIPGNCVFGHILKKSLMENFIFCTVSIKESSINSQLI